MIFNVTGGGGTGAVLTVKAPAGATVTVSKDGKTKTKVADASGTAVFKGLISGDWTITMTDGVQTSAPKTVTITTDYEAEISFFSATIHVRYPSGLSCTATCGDVTLPAPDASGVWDLVVSNAGTWVFKAGDVLTAEVTVVETGEAHTVNAWRDYIFKSGVGFVREAYYDYASNNITIDPNKINVLSPANGCILTSELLDVRGYTSLKIETNTYTAGPTSGYQGALAFAVKQGKPATYAAANTGSYFAYGKITNSTERQIFETPVTTAITKECCPGITGHCKAEILNLWLEKVVQ